MHIHREMLSKVMREPAIQILTIQVIIKENRIIARRIPIHIRNHILILLQNIVPLGIKAILHQRIAVYTRTPIVLQIHTLLPAPVTAVHQ